VWISGMGSSTCSETEVSANNGGTIVVIPEVVRGEWSPCTSLSSFNPSFSSDSEFRSSLHVVWSPW
jgi:hypothetical protein